MKRSRAQKPASTSVDLLALRECVEQFTSKTVVLLGDFVADEFQYGEISRVSREAPVLILKHRETKIVPGGGANAANNLASLGAHVLPVTAVGDDFAGDALIVQFRRQGVDISGIFRVKGWTTPTKSRFLAGWAHTVGQQVLRVDYEPKGPLPDVVRKKLQQRLSASLGHAHALAVSDYGFNIATPELVQQASAKRKSSLQVTLDARYRLHRYAKAGITSATPNESELEAEHHTAIGQDTGELTRAGRETLSEMKLQSPRADPRSRQRSSRGCHWCRRHRSCRLHSGSGLRGISSGGCAHRQHRWRLGGHEARNGYHFAPRASRRHPRRGIRSWLLSYA